MFYAFKALSYVPAFSCERVAEARVSRSLRWLHVTVQLERLYISVVNNTTLIALKCEPRAVVRVRVRRCVIRVRINETVVRIRIVTATTNATAMETLYLFCSLTTAD